MVTLRSNKNSTDPAPEFDERCVQVVRRWQHGDLPFNDAIEQVMALSQEAQESEHLANEGRAEHALGFLQHYRGNLDSSIRHYDHARSLFRKVGNLDRVGTMDLNLGENYRFKGDFNRALHLYRSAYELGRRTNNIPNQTMAALNEGLVLLTIGQNSSAMDVFKTAIELTTQWKDPDDPNLTMLLCELYHGVAVVFLRQKRYHDAWDNALRALKIAEETGLLHQLGYAMRTTGEVITELGEAPEAGFSSDPDTYFRAAFDAFQQVNEEAELARTMFAQALSLSKRGKRNMSARKLQQAIIIFSKLGMVDDAARAAEAQLAVV